MARRNSIEFRNKLHECIVEDCEAQLKNKDLPDHYLTEHGSETGRFQCNAKNCDFSCSNSDICIENHILEVHGRGNAFASFNPLRKKDLLRIRNKCTDQCGEKKVKVNGKKKKVNQESEIVVLETVTLSMTSKSKTAIAEGTNSQVQNATRMNKTRASNDESNSNKRRRDSDVGETPERRRRGDESGTSSVETPSSARNRVQAEKGKGGKGKRSKVVATASDMTSEEVRRDVIEEDENIVANNSHTSQRQEDIETGEGTSESGTSDQENETDEEDDTIYDAESDQENVVDMVPPINIEEADEATVPRAELAKRRGVKNKRAFMKFFTQACEEYTLREFYDYMEVLLEQRTDNPRQSTEELIENLGNRNPHLMILNEVTFPVGAGDIAYIEAVHESIVESSRKLQIDFVRFLVKSSKKFIGHLTEKIWESLMAKTAEYMYSEHMKDDESILIEKVLGLRVLYEAYRMTL